MLRRRKSKTRSSTLGVTSAAYVRPAADVARAAAAMNDVDDRFARTPWSQYRRLDQEHRSRTLSRPDWFPDWHLVRPEDVARIAELSDKPVTAGGLLSMHPDGYVREAAVYVLAQSEQADALPFLIIRAADWVEQVRLPAKEGVQLLLDVANTDQLLRAAALIATMTSAEARGRDFSSAARMQIVKRFATSQLLEALGHPDLHVRRLAAEIIIERGDAESALDRALLQRDQVTARVISVVALDQAADEDAVLAKLSRSRIASLRALALYRYQSHEAPNALTASELALLDRSPNVRYLAQRYLAQNGSDVRSRYVNALATIPVAAQGLAEVGGTADAKLIEPLLGDDRIRLRVAAVLAIGRLLGPKSRTTIMTMLDDPSPSVVRVAGRVLARQPLTSGELDRLWERATDPDAPDALKRAAFVVFGQQGRWPKLVLACRAVVSDDSFTRGRGELMLGSVLSAWNNSATDPTAEQLNELKRVQGTVAEHIDATLAREFVALVNSHHDGNT